MCRRYVTLRSKGDESDDLSERKESAVGAVVANQVFKNW